MNLTLRVWRQANAAAQGGFATYSASGISPDMSFLEMLDVVNEAADRKGEAPIAFDHDCREGICGTCGMVINGTPHGPRRLTTTCQLHMRSFHGRRHDHDRAVARAPPSRSSRTSSSTAPRSIASSRPGASSRRRREALPTATRSPLPKGDAERAMDAAACIGCGACVAACPNASASLFVAAKISHLGLLPQGQAERDSRALGHGGSDGCRAVRIVHESRRVRGGVSEGDLARHRSRA